MREGYKMTEFGEIPIEWEVRKLQDVFEVCQYGISNSLSEEGKYPVLRMNNIKDGKVHLSDLKFVDLDEKEYGKYRLNKNDILFNRTNSIDLVGKTGIYNTDAISTFASYLVRLRTDKTIAEPRFVNYYMNSDKGQERIRLYATLGVSQANINAENLKKVSIPIAPLKEQQKIADILSTVDEQIENTESLIEKTKELKKGLMQRLLTKGIGHTEFKETEAGVIPKKWQVRRLADIASKIGDGLHGTPVYYEQGEYYFINGNNLINGKVIVSTETKRVGKEEYTKYKKELNENTLLISLNGTIGNLALYNCEKVVLSKSSGYVTLIDAVDRKFIFYALANNTIQSYFLKELTGTTIKNLSLDTLRKTPIALPNIGEQQIISSILSSVDERIEQYEIKKQKHQQLKQSLMQKLLTGKIRVKV